jgi:hypothetical protein
MEGFSHGDPGPRPARSAGRVPIPPARSAGEPAIVTTLLPGTPELLSLHARVLPQRDDLCGAFCAALALHALGVSGPGGEPLDQDDVALAAGSLVSARPQPQILPHGERGRRDYRLQLPRIDDGERSGTTAAGVVAAVERVSASAALAIPLAGPWDSGTLAATFELARSVPHGAALVANLATHHLWGSHASLEQLLGWLLLGRDEGPPPDWHVGHFVLIAARSDGPGGSMYALADTYPALGVRGVHMQPEPRLAAAIARPDMPAGGVIAIVTSAAAPAFREGATRLGLREALWDNGTPEAERAA